MPIAHELSVACGFQGGTRIRASNIPCALCSTPGCAASTRLVQKRMTLSPALGIWGLVSLPDTRANPVPMSAPQTVFGPQARDHVPTPSATVFFFFNSYRFVVSCLR